MNKGTSKAGRTRDFIIEKTADIFNRQGFAGTSLSDLTKATGLTKGSIYGNFENKEEVALAVFEYNRVRIYKYIQDEMAGAATFHDKLMVYGKVYRRVIEATGNMGGCPILNTAIEADDTNPLLKQGAAKAVISWQQALISIINSGMGAGEFRQDTAAADLAISIIALIEGAVMIAKVTDDLSRMDQVLGTVERLIAGIRA
ncbi:TetR/AcrR family transcriptional regulator [Dyadobacter sandarakinus]|uniref:TetR/AcrR family transcriptional regulator n=1 Tax=Dyadobacter sandarakinus TaxID=2747268 RepID=A0ABX7I1C1_9BACT|nr:TetR/AcrR family transcriptional regulator [Dyadobacter sandarakinus]QRQ99860.1 TetR/AcrR family transcriptional regulator [Dyadobacter sandarakinus]